MKVDMKRFVPSHIVNKLVSELTLLCALEEVGSFLRRPCVGFVGSEAQHCWELVLICFKEEDKDAG